MHIALASFVGAFAVLAAAVPQPSNQKAGVAIPITKRSGLVNPDKTVNIEALHAQAAAAQAKILRGLSNFEKNTGHPHPASKGIERRGTGTDSLTDFQNALWYGTISVGSPPSTFTVDFDTGSSDLFLPGPSCGQTCDGHAVYNPGSSSSAVDLGKTFSLSYGDGSSVEGEQYSDTVTIAGLTATDQTLGAATEYSSGFAASQFPADGLMGMAFESISGYPASPVFQTLISEGQLDESVFTFNLASSGSELYLGGVNTDQQITYVPVTQVGFWQVTMDSIQGNGQDILSSIDSIIDTGTTLIIGDPDSVESFYNALGGSPAPSSVGAGYYTFPCNSFPAVSFTFGGTAFPISADTLNQGQVSSGSSDCVSGIISQADTPSDAWVIGDVFLQNVYTVFDVGNSQVGFASLV